MSLRAAALQDIPALFDVRLAVTENAIDAAGLAYLGITPASVAALLQTHGRAWVVEHDGRVVGFSIADAEAGSVWAVFVRPAYAGRGYGRRLLEAAVAWLWAQGLETVWLSTGAEAGTRAHGFYRHLGWEPAGKLPNGELRYVRHREAGPAGQSRR